MPEIVERFLRYKRQPGTQAVMEQVGAQLAAMRGGAVDFLPRLPSVRARTLVVWGREDRVLPAAHAENARAIPGARIHIFDGCGHVPQLEAAEAFNMLLFEFLTNP
jgi:4,5:9,10-diseco-3-hydroxy-5,9,17-trioxoandrosta-1(10),2-diene-4-oate hydrolase